MDVKSKVPTTIEAVVIRADGTRVDLGKISDSRWWWKFTGKILADRKINKANRRMSSGN